jgi:diguanylate cyclase (GGDEF)-like protein/PAS domain S-box-containing protein
MPSDLDAAAPGRVVVPHERVTQSEDLSTSQATMLASSVDAIIGLRLDRVIISWNTGAERLYGYAASEMIGCSVGVLAVPGAPDETPQIRAALLQGAPIVDLDALRRHKDGSVRPVSISVSPVRDRSGALVGAVGIHREISARKAAEAARLQVEQRFRDLLEAAPDAMLACDAVGRITLVNSRAEALFGYRREEVLGQPIELLVPEALRSRHAQYRADYLADPHTRRPMVGLYARTKDVRLVPVEVSLSPLAGAGEEQVIAAIRDVSERQQLAAALQASEQRYRLAFDDAPIGMALVAPDGRLLEVNHALCRMVGYSEQELLDMGTPVLTHPDDVAESRSRMRQLLAGEISTATLEKRYLHKQGQVVWTSYTVSLLRAADRNPLYFICHLQDVTARTVAEHARAQLAAVVEASRDAIIGTTREGVITSWNRGAERLYGYTAEEAIGQPNMLVVPPDRHAEIADMMQQLVRGEHIAEYETERVRKDGTRVPVSMTLSPVHDAHGAMVAVAVVTRAIAERKAAEAALRASEQRARILIEHAPIGAAVADEQGILELVNDTYAAFYGYGREEMIGQPITMLVPPEERAALAAAYADMLARARDERGEYLVVTRSGERRTVLSHSVQYPGPDGRPRRATFSLDITERKAHEDRLAYVAQHDTLTGVPNRVLFTDRLEQALLAARRERVSVALLLIDLDGFKTVNDRWGHAAGDALLRVVAKRLQAAVRSSDTVARLGGDEFAVLLPHADRTGAIRVAGLLCATLAEPVLLSDATAQVDSSIGIALYPEHGEDAETLQRCADHAMYAAKGAGGGYLMYGQRPERPAR